MSRIFRSSCALALAFVVSGCPKPTPPPPVITLTASATTLPGDGKSQVSIDVSRPGKVDVTLRVGRGTFKESGKNSYVLAGGNGTATFVACDSSEGPGCAGNVTIRASSDDDGAGQLDLVINQSEICNDGIDNDKNGKIDCADGICLNQACSSADAGVRLCDSAGLCSCSTGTDEDCGNGKDDNCDGLVDCADPACDLKACNVNPGVGGTCRSKVCGCTPNTEDCTNGKDDDCDGKIDCVDSDCTATTVKPGKVCDTTTGLTCSILDGTGKSTCTVCPGNATSEAAALCADGKDNDCDGVADCLDTDCAAKDCRSSFADAGVVGSGWKCNLASVPTDKCECTGNGGAPQATETSCDDLSDNDCDGKVDCADPDCLVAGGQVCGTFGKKCLALGSCSCGATLENCKTPEDDNCNGKVNCEETSCRPTGSTPGALCDESGNTCSQLIGGVSTCSTCTGNGGLVEAAEGSTGGVALTCGDLKDNDCDSTAANPSVDCQDSDCSGKPCSITGKVCDFASKSCVCPSGKTNETGLCGDGLDNDCDGKSDCLDPDCQPSGSTPGSACANGGTCSAAGACVCGGNGGVVEATEATCGDGHDNDCDGKVDCLDPDCQPKGTAPGKLCDANGNTCSATSACSVCSGNGGTVQVSEASCADGKDNDCDGLVDCLDTNCATLDCKSAFSTSPAGNGWKCNLASTPTDKCACTGNGGAVQATETTCTDGFDNDCDGKIDCADPDCANQPCPGGSGKKCVALNTCACGATVEDCKTPIDDNCNGLVNCEETSCRPTGTTPGALCDESGNTCSQILAGVSTCSTCTGNGGLVEVNEGSTTGGAIQTCGDGKDNDCDSTLANPSTDCQDPDCSGKPCSLNGGFCNFAVKRCACPGGLNNEQGLCADGLDNDCDGKIDCLDPDCQPIGTAPGSACGAGNGRLCTPAGACACSGNGGTAEAVEATCSDGRDNDCDGVADCGDTDCRPVGNNPGKTCDAKGNTCANPVSGVSACNVCSGNGGQAQTSEFSCGDGKDNDCDGKIDCQDPKCNTLACTSSGKRCEGASLTCVCPGAQALGETSCGDGLDNDCDGLVDCADPNCQPLAGNTAGACSATGKFCTTGGLCACSGNGGTVEVTEGLIGPSTCGDGIDNDCDGVVDCLDTDCKAATAGTFGKDCSKASLFATRCDVSGVCVCPGGQATEATCGDGLDNDCDGKIDCQDPDCANQLCPGGNGKKCIGSPLACGCPGGQVSETTCDDGLDNDCDGLVDCADPNCQGNPGLACNAGSATYKCILSGATYVCGDPSANFTVAIKSTPVVVPSSSTPNRVPADGVSTSTIAATLKNAAGAAVVGGTMTFSVTGGGAVLPVSAVTNASGVATTTYTAPTTQGTAVVTATYSATSGSASIDLPRLGQIKFLTQQYSVMGVRSSSFQETNQLTFQLLDTNSQPYPPGLTVTFTHQQFGGSYIGSTANCSGSPVTCTATGVTDNTGFVSVLLHSGTIASVVSVTADATAGGASASASASNIAIVGAKANSLHMSLDCTPKNVPALANSNCTNSFLPATITCRVAFADRFNNVLGVATLATFTSEAGAAGTPTTTPAYSPGNTNLGIASGFVSVGGYSLPVDVVPFAGEYSEAYDDGRCGMKEHNPRDGLVTIIVSANGEEGFVDGSNGQPLNGQYDPGEFLMDQGEPFVDANDNGTHDNGEAYVDGNGDGLYNGPNGVWDANTVVWAETRVMYTGFSQVYSVGTAPVMNHVSRLFDPLAVPPSPPTPTAQPNFYGWTMGSSHSVNFGLRFADSNFNYPAQSTAYSLTVVKPGIAATFSPPAPAPEDKLGLTFSQQFCDTALVCGSVCSSSVSASPFCRLTSKVANYTYGYGASVNVSYTPPTTPVAIPDAEVRANSTIGGVNVPVSVMGSVQ